MSLFSAPSHKLCVKIFPTRKRFMKNLKKGHTIKIPFTMHSYFYKICKLKFSKMIFKKHKNIKLFYKMINLKSVCGYTLKMLQ